MSPCIIYKILSVLELFITITLMLMCLIVLTNFKNILFSFIIRKFINLDTNRYLELIIRNINIVSVGFLLGDT